MHMFVENVHLICTATMSYRVLIFIPFSQNFILKMRWKGSYYSLMPKLLPHISGIFKQRGILKQGRRSQMTPPVLRKCHLTQRRFQISFYWDNFSSMWPLKPDFVTCFMKKKKRFYESVLAEWWWWEFFLAVCSHLPLAFNTKSSTGLLTFPPMFIFLLPLSISLPYCSPFPSLEFSHLMNNLTKLR